MNPMLRKSYKGRFPFRLGTTSYIYPLGYAANVDLLGAWLDEIELLFFESHPGTWPSAAELSELVELAEKWSLGYNIHLPLDLAMGHVDANLRCTAVETVIRLFELAAPLAPATWTLHLPLDADLSDPAAVAAWRRRILDSLRQLVASGISPRSVTIENLDYPIEWLYEFSKQTGFRMCLDVGHLITQRGDVSAAYRRFQDRIDVIHLHGVRNGKDHLSLAVFPERDFSWIAELLATYTGSLTLEVFSFESLRTSLDFFEKIWEKRFDADPSDVSEVTG